MFMAAPGLTPRQKAAVVVRMLLAEGDDLDLSVLSPAAQALLAQEMAGMELVDRATCDAVLAEFCDQLDRLGLAFPGGIAGTLDLLGAHLSAEAADGLRRAAALTGAADPWDRIAALPPVKLAELARCEAVEIAAVMFSRLPVARASEVFALLEPELARRVAYAMSLTGGIEETALRRIGLALMRASDALPQPAIEAPPVEKVGALLNLAPSATRDMVLAGLDRDDAGFAGQVRRTIFTWVNIPARIDRRDVPRILREIEGATLTRALAGAQGDDAATVEFLLGAVSSRLADTMREEIETAGKVGAKEAEEAMAVVMAAIRRMEAAGELFLIPPDQEEGAAP